MFGFKSRVLFLCAAAALLGACGSSSVSTSGLSPDAAAGKKLAVRECGSCHSVNGADGVGPTWKGLSGSNVKLANGQTVTADEAYLTTAIQDPDAQVVAGYHSGVMSSAFPKGKVSDAQTRELIAYIDTLK